MSVITALQMQKRNKERVNVFLDGDYAFSLALIEAAKLKKGQTLSDSDIAELKGEDEVQRAVDQAARFLAYRPRSGSEIRDNLKSHGYDATVIESAMGQLERLGYLDDRAFVRFWLENRDTFKPRGLSALKHELRQKGIASELIDEILAGFDEEDAAYRAAYDKARRLQGLSRKDFRHKISSYLQRRGFGYGKIRDVLTQLENELVAEDEAFFTNKDESDQPDSLD